jgi:hypothetical protein
MEAFKLKREAVPAPFPFNGAMAQRFKIQPLFQVVGIF